MRYARFVLLGLMALAALLLGPQTPPALATSQATAFNFTGLTRLCETTLPASGMPSICTAENTAAGAAADLTLDLKVPWGQYSSPYADLMAGDSMPHFAVFTPPAAVVSPGTSLPMGAIVGKIRSGNTIGLVNSRCYPGASDTYTVETSLTLMNATVNTALTLDPLSPAAEGSEGTLEPFRDDSNGNGLPDHVDFYPSYLNKVLDPDRAGDFNADGDEADTIFEASAEGMLALDVNGDTDMLDAVDLNLDGDTLDSAPENGPAAPLVPLARYSSSILFAGTALLVELLVFEPGDLPVTDLNADMGYPTVVVVGDPFGAPHPSAITDGCSPFRALSVLLGQTRDNPCTPAGAGLPNDGVGCQNSNTDCTPGPCGNNVPINVVDVCANEVDDDADGATNDGCPSVGPPESGGSCNDNGGVAGADADNDGDLFVDDGCGTVAGTPESSCGTCVGGHKTSGGEAGYVRYRNPAAGTGLLGTGTHLYMTGARSFRDADGDGYENRFDTCPFDVNLEDGRVENGPAAEGGPLGGDAIDSACDAAPSVNNGSNADGDLGAFALVPWSNAQDNCPQNPNPSQRDADSLVLVITAPSGGPRGDGIGDACEGAETGAECTTPDADNDDGDARVNDGCPQIGVVSETGAAQCTNAVDDDAAGDSGEPDGAGASINDGCPAIDGSGDALRSNGHFHVHLDLIPKCIGGSDDDGDGFCNTTETTMGSDPGSAASAGESAQSGDGAENAGMAGGQCANGSDDDGDGKVNDGCPASGPAEFAAQCENASNDDGDGATNDGCFAVGRGNCADGVNNDGDASTDASDAGCKTPEDHALEFPIVSSNAGAGPDANDDAIPDNDGAGPADDDAVNTAAGQQEEPHQVCGDDIDQDGDGARDAFATLNEGGADGMSPDSSCSSHVANDADRDSLSDSTDNCASVFNPNQTDFDGDGIGDRCDPNDDNDAYTDIQELLCGSRAFTTASFCGDPDTDDDGVNDSSESSCGTNSFDAASRPERLDLLGDDDGDGDLNEALPGGSGGFDCDGDGWTGAQEALIFGTGGTVSDQDSCGNNGWPADLDPNNALSIGDFNSFIFPNGPDDGHGVFAYFGHPVPDAGRVNEERWDLSPNAMIDIGDINALNPMVTAASARPPMFNGQQAFFAGACPWPP